MPSPEHSPKASLSPHTVLTVDNDAICVCKGDEVVAKSRQSIRAPLTRSRLKVTFQTGRFQVFGLDVLLADFEDPELQRIDVVGLLANAGGGWERFNGSIGAFSVSGPGIPDHNRAVQPQGKLATTWGALKQF